MFKSCQYQPPFDLPLMTMTSYQGKLIALDWHNHKTNQLLFKISQQTTNHNLTYSELNQQVLLDTIQQLDEYFAGYRQLFDIPLNLSFGTTFQQRVWQALLAIPYGKTISYAQLAKNINKPIAFRAVANANGKNPISLIIPCHRVVASNGSLGGYTGGLFIKKQLLSIEKLAID